LIGVVPTIPGKWQLASVQSKVAQLIAQPASSGFAYSGCEVSLDETGAKRSSQGNGCLSQVAVHISVGMELGFPFWSI
jgi:hypothetical protein